MRAFGILLLSLSATAMAVPEAVPGEYIIRFKSRQAAKTYFNNSAYTSVGQYQSLGTLVPFAKVKARTKQEARQIAYHLRTSQEVAYAEPNYIYRIQGFTSAEDMRLNRQYVGTSNKDSRFGELWGLRNTGQKGGLKGMDINVVDAWKRGVRGDRRLKIAVIDTGVDYTHPDLESNIWTNPGEIPGNGKDDDGNGYVDDVHGYDFANNDADPMDDNRHGTHCAGTIAAVHNREGVAGVLGQAAIIPVKFLTGSGGGTLEAAIKSIDYANRVGAHIMSNSWGGGGYSAALYESIKRATDRGIVFVAAAGNDRNDNDKRPSYPAGYQLDNVISVAAHDNKGNKAVFTNFGRRTVHVSAPGVSILSTIPGGQYQYLSGTSMATPHVTGVVGMVLTQLGVKSAQTMRNRLLLTSRLHSPLDSISASRGVVDTLAALLGKRSQ